MGHKQRHQIISGCSIVDFEIASLINLQKIIFYLLPHNIHQDELEQWLPTEVPWVDVRGAPNQYNSLIIIPNKQARGAAKYL